MTWRITCRVCGWREAWPHDPLNERCPWCAAPYYTRRPALTGRTPGETLTDTDTP